MRWLVDRDLYRRINQTDCLHGVEMFSKEQQPASYTRHASPCSQATATFQRSEPDESCQLPRTRLKVSLNTIIQTKSIPDGQFFKFFHSFSCNYELTSIIH